MKKNYLKIIFFFLILSCNKKTNIDYESEFDKILGKENIKTLDFLVKDFENDFLKRQYPNLDTEKAYNQFLVDKSKGNVIKWKKISKKTIDIFNASTLLKDIYEFPDSVWILKNSTFDKIESDSMIVMENNLPYMKSRFKTINQDGTIDYKYSRYFGNINPKSNYDSIIKTELKRKHLNGISKYMIALNTIMNKENFLKIYVDHKNSAGLLFPENAANIMLKNKIDLKDKINRRIIVLEFIY